MTLQTAPLNDLAGTITLNARIVTDFLRQGNHAQPFFSVDGPAAFLEQAPDEVQLARGMLRSAARELDFLAAWPTEAVRWHALSGVSNAIERTYKSIH